MHRTLLGMGRRVYSGLARMTSGVSPIGLPQFAKNADHWLAMALAQHGLWLAEAVLRVRREWPFDEELRPFPEWKTRYEDD